MQPDDFEVIEPARREAILSRLSQAPYPRFLGLQFEDLRRDYSRMRLPYRPEIDQPAGIIHGGAIASLIDTVVVGAILSGLEGPPRKLFTIDLHVHYLETAIREDLIAEARVRRRGRSIVFLEVEVSANGGRTVAHGEISYKVAL